MSEQPAFWLDGVPASALPLPDRGLDYGDGLFETLLLHGGSPLYPVYHMERLARGLQALGFPDCLALARSHLDTVAGEISKRSWAWSALRLTVTRGGGPRGYAPPADAVPRTLIQVSRINRDCGRMNTPATLSTASLRLSVQPQLAGIKHLNRLEQVLAAAEGRAQGVDETLLLDQSRQLVSVVAGNLFLLHQERLLTPALKDCGVAGTRRRLVIEKWAPAIGLEVQEAALTLQDLESAEALFYCNSLQGLRPVKQLGAQRWRDHSCCDALFQQYQAEL